MQCSRVAPECAPDRHIGIAFFTGFTSFQIELGAGHVGVFLDQFSQFGELPALDQVEHERFVGRNRPAQVFFPADPAPANFTDGDPRLAFAHAGCDPQDDPEFQHPVERSERKPQVETVAAVEFAYG